MPPNSRKRSADKKGQAAIPCQYDCGRLSAGCLSIDFYPNDDEPEAFRRGFTVRIPCCRECIKSAIKVAITIPEVAAK